MSAQRHQVGRQILEIHVQDDAAAWPLQSELGRIQKMHLEALIDRCCTEASDPDRLHRIQSLEVDLGRLDPGHLERDLVAALGPALRAALAKRIREDEEEAALTGSDPDVDARLELVAHFARRGHLPWWADASGARILDEPIGWLLERARPSLVTLVRELACERDPLMRLVLHCEDERLSALLGALLAATRPDLPGRPAELRALLGAHTAVPAARPSGFRVAVWMGVLRAACIEDGAAAGRMGFWREALVRVALEAGVTYGSLVTGLLGLLGAERSGWPGALGEVVRSLSRQMRGEAQVRGEAARDEESATGGGSTSRGEASTTEVGSTAHGTGSTGSAPPPRSMMGPVHDSGEARTSELERMQTHTVHREPGSDGVHGSAPDAAPTERPALLRFRDEALRSEALRSEALRSEARREPVLAGGDLASPGGEWASADGLASPGQQSAGPLPRTRVPVDDTGEAQARELEAILSRLQEPESALGGLFAELRAAVRDAPAARRAELLEVLRELERMQTHTVHREPGSDGVHGSAPDAAPTERPALLRFRDEALRSEALRSEALRSEARREPVLAGGDLASPGGEWASADGLASPGQQSAGPLPRTRVPVDDTGEAQARELEAILSRLQEPESALGGLFAELRAAVRDAPAARRAELLEVLRELERMQSHTVHREPGSDGVHGNAPDAAPTERPAVLRFRDEAVRSEALRSEARREPVLTGGELASPVGEWASPVEEWASPVEEWASPVEEWASADGLASPGQQSAGPLPRTRVPVDDTGEAQAREIEAILTRLQELEGPPGGLFAELRAAVRHSPAARRAALLEVLRELERMPTRTVHREPGNDGVWPLTPEAAASLLRALQHLVEPGWLPPRALLRAAIEEAARVTPRERALPDGDSVPHDVESAPRDLESAPRDLESAPRDLEESQAREIEAILARLEELESPYGGIFAELRLAVRSASAPRREALLEPLRHLYRQASTHGLLAPESAASLLRALRQIIEQHHLPAEVLAHLLERMEQEGAAPSPLAEAPLERAILQEARTRLRAALAAGAGAPAARRASEPSPRNLEYIESDDAYVENAGLVVLWPFLGHLFERLELMADRQFHDGAARIRAAGLVQHLATGDLEPVEYQLPLAKVLCGVEMTEVFDFGPPVTEVEAEECANLLTAAIANAPILGEMSIAGFRGSFLVRKGVLGTRDGAWLLRVERESHDVVLDRFPWAVSLVKLPWMEVPLCVEW